ncbi:TetR family transcriptional regulator [Tersicoccus sp. MR15.9]|uniref:TetR/AcrR family transcriptional regulator n=1 Tax=Tersicoccus mangrovi TaxID=3121635 RepID=UPI002FE58ECF
MTTRERALAAAVRLVGTQGIRALTHARVDAEAGLPRGSTSNHFRTRAALVAGVTDWIAEQERALLAASMTSPGTLDEVVDAFSGVLEDLTGPNADRTRTRYALFLELGAHRDVQAPLRAQRVRFEAWTRELLTGLGAPHPDAATRAFMAFSAGLILNRLTVDRDAPLRPTVELAVRGCLAAV